MTRDTGVEGSSKCGEQRKSRVRLAELLFDSGEMRE
jgi:hypothetical protein